MWTCGGSVHLGHSPDTMLERKRTRVPMTTDHGHELFTAGIINLRRCFRLSVHPSFRDSATRGGRGPTHGGSRPHLYNEDTSFSAVACSCDLANSMTHIFSNEHKLFISLNFVVSTVINQIVLGHPGWCPHEPETAPDK